MWKNTPKSLFGVSDKELTKPDRKSSEDLQEGAFEVKLAQADLKTHTSMRALVGKFFVLSTVVCSSVASSTRNKRRSGASFFIKVCFDN